MSNIEWTNQTWNPITGCSVVSPGCTNCYAMKEAWRFGHNPKLPQYRGLTKMTKGGAVWTGKLRLHEPALQKPLKRQTPTTYFVNSMGDLFHEDMPKQWIDRVFAIMALCPQHTFQILTKRAERMREYIRKAHSRVGDLICDLAMELELPVALVAHPSMEYAAPQLPMVRLYQWPLPNVWLGVSAENQEQANIRIPDLLATPAAIRFVSVEPMLGPVDLTDLCNGHYFMDALRGFEWHDNPDGVPSFRSIPPGPHPRLGEPAAHLNWVICGGESGKGARPMHPDWARSLRDQCSAAGVPYFFKQWGGWLPESQDPNGLWNWSDADDRGLLHFWADEDRSASIPLKKKQTGNLLDGRQHLEMPA